MLISRLLKKEGLLISNTIDIKILKYLINIGKLPLITVSKDNKRFICVVKPSTNSNPPGTFAPISDSDFNQIVIAFSYLKVSVTNVILDTFNITNCRRLLKDAFNHLKELGSISTFKYYLNIYTI